MVSSSVWIHAYILCTTQLPYYLSFFNGKNPCLYLVIFDCLYQYDISTSSCAWLFSSGSTETLMLCIYMYLIQGREQNYHGKWHWFSVTHGNILKNNVNWKPHWADFKQENCLKNSGSVKVTELQGNCIWSFVTSILSFIVQLTNCSNSCREQKVLSAFLYADVWMQGWGSISTHVDEFIFSY